MSLNTLQNICYPYSYLVELSACRSRVTNTVTFEACHWKSCSFHFLYSQGIKQLWLHLYIAFARSNGRYPTDFPTHTSRLCFPHHPSDVPSTFVLIILRELSKRWLPSSFNTPRYSLISCTVYQNSSLTFLFSVTCNVYFLAHCRFLFIIKLPLQLIECS
jgi:hypothetical protein